MKDEIRQMIEDTAEAIAQAEPDPARWGAWIIYLAECLEVKAMDLDPDHPDATFTALARVQEAFETRLEGFPW